MAQTKNLLAMQETQVRSLGREDSLEKEMATHSRIFAWRIPWTEEPDRLQSMGSQRVGHDSVTTCAHTHTHRLILCPGYLYSVVLNFFCPLESHEKLQSKQDCSCHPWRL